MRQPFIGTARRIAIAAAVLLATCGPAQTAEEWATDCKAHGGDLAPDPQNLNRRLCMTPQPGYGPPKLTYEPVAPRPKS
jgi:hypothetical protein